MVSDGNGKAILKSKSDETLRELAVEMACPSLMDAIRTMPVEWDDEGAVVPVWVTLPYSCFKTCETE